MADEFNTNSSWFFDCDSMQLVVSKISGLAIEIKVAAGSGAIGITNEGKTQTQATPGEVSYGSAIKLEYVAGNEADQQKLMDWYKKCHATSFSGGATSSRKERKTASLFIMDGNGNIGAQYDFTDIFPSNMTQTSQLDVSKPGELCKDTVELRFTQVIRVDQ
ncbi:MAG TPA: phage tail protein [Cyanobacteria bacterium UBA8803]|nr:phage tail protein [Cyanobacteria bacterium UBA9273]HBL58193.1 phage tail protein [Cyanobacteria bacterium UBA8803]